jgi:hypothetical protein
MEIRITPEQIANASIGNGSSAVAAGKAAAAGDPTLLSNFLAHALKSQIRRATRDDVDAGKKALEFLDCIDVKVEFV